jgi:hypothetical protein
MMLGLQYRYEAPHINFGTTLVCPHKYKKSMWNLNSIHLYVA